VSKCIVMYACGDIVVADFPNNEHSKLVLVQSIAQGTASIVNFSDFDGLPCELWGNESGQELGRQFNFAASGLLEAEYPGNNGIFGDVLLLPEFSGTFWNGFDADRAVQFCKDIKFYIHTYLCRAMAAYN
jgi:hypothetical protein